MPVRFARVAPPILRYLSRGRRRFYTLLIRGGFLECGAGTTFEPPLRLNGQRNIAVGSNVFIGSGSWLQVLDSLSGGSIRIGDGASLAGMDVLSAAQEIVLEQDVLLARNVYIADHSHAFEDKSLPIRLQGITKIAPVRIGRGAWLGQNVVICPGTTIGRGAVVGANSVVNRDVPDFSVAVGAPARVIRTVE